MWTFPNLKLGVKKMWQGDRLLIKQPRGNPMHPLNLTAKEVQKLKGQNGHPSNACLQPQFITRRHFSRSSGRSTEKNMTSLWMIWMWIWLFGAYFGTQLFEQQFILDKTTRWIYITWRTILGTVWENSSMKTGKLISEQKEITGASTGGFKDATWMPPSLLCEKACQISNTKTYVFSETVLCRVKMGDGPTKSHRRHVDGVRLENIPRIHDIGHPPKNSRSDERPTVWTWKLQRLDHLYVNDLGVNGNTEKCETHSIEYCLFATVFCPVVTVFTIPTLEQFDQLKMIWKICEFLFIIVQQVSLHNLIGPKRSVRSRQIW